jgi:hypothetical protein
LAIERINYKKLQIEFMSLFIGLSLGKRQPGKFLFDKEQTIFLTSLIGTQLLLTTSPPDYPIIKATEFTTEEVS